MKNLPYTKLTWCGVALMVKHIMTKFTNEEESKVHTILETLYEINTNNSQKTS